MSLFDRLRDNKHYQRARSRLSKTEATQVALWADSSVWAVQEQLDFYRRTRAVEGLEEARKGTLGLLAAIDDLLDKHR